MKITGKEKLVFAFSSQISIYIEGTTQVIFTLRCFIFICNKVEKPGSLRNIDTNGSNAWIVLSATF